MESKHHRVLACSLAAYAEFLSAEEPARVFNPDQQGLAAAHARILGNPKFWKLSSHKSVAVSSSLSILFSRISRHISYHFFRVRLHKFRIHVSLCGRGRGMDFGYVPLGGEGTPTKYCFQLSVISQSEKREIPLLLSRPSLCSPLFLCQGDDRKEMADSRKGGGRKLYVGFFFFFAFPLVSEPPFP